MELTSVYWIPIFELLDERGFEVNAFTTSNYQIKWVFVTFRAGRNRFGPLTLGKHGRIY